MSERIVEIRRGQILTAVDVAAAVPGEGGRFTGLIDTGAQESGISELVIAATGPFEPSGYRRIAPLGGPGVETPSYRLWLGLRFGTDDDPSFGGQFGTFWQIPSRPVGFDVLVGMDIIERFAVSIERGICTLRRRDVGLRSQSR